MEVLKLLGAARDPEVQEGDPLPPFPLLNLHTFAVVAHLHLWVLLIEDFFEQVGRFAARRPYTPWAEQYFSAPSSVGTITSWKGADFELWVPKGSRP